MGLVTTIPVATAEKKVWTDVWGTAVETTWSGLWLPWTSCRDDKTAVACYTGCDYTK